MDCESRVFAVWTRGSTGSATSFALAIMAPNCWAAAKRRGSIGALAQNRAQAAHNRARIGVGDDGFQAVADFGAVFSIFDREEDQDAFVFPFFADAPLVIKLVGDVGDVVAIESIDGDNGHLRSGGALDDAAIGFDPLRAGRVDAHGRNR